MRSLFAVVLGFFVGALAACTASGPSGPSDECSATRACPPPQVCNEGTCVTPYWLDGGALDLSPSSGCQRGGGTHLGNNVWACDGPFPVNSAPALCRSGFEICKTADKVPAAACQSVIGFFASAATLYSTDFDKCTTIDPKFISCSNGTYQYRLGCGTSPLVAVLACEHSCSGFSRGIACSKAAVSGYFCGGAPPPQNDQSSSPGFGVLCCPL